MDAEPWLKSEAELELELQLALAKRREQDRQEEEFALGQQQQQQLQSQQRLQQPSQGVSKLRQRFGHLTQKSTCVLVDWAGLAASCSALQLCCVQGIQRPAHFCSGSQPAQPLRPGRQGAQLLSLTGAAAVSCGCWHQGAVHVPVGTRHPASAVSPACRRASCAPSGFTPPAQGCSVQGLRPG